MEAEKLGSGMGRALGLCMHWFYSDVHSAAANETDWSGTPGSTWMVCFVFYRNPACLSGCFIDVRRLIWTI